MGFEVPQLGVLREWSEPSDAEEREERVMLRIRVVALTLTRTRLGRLSLTVGAVALIVGALAGCGGGSDSSSTSAGADETTTEASTTADDSGSSSTEAKLAPYLQFEKTIQVPGPLKKLPENADVLFLECSALPCKQEGEGLKRGAELLKLNYKALSSGATPESFQSAAEQAVREKPDAVLLPALQPSIIKTQLQELNEEGVVVALWATEQPPAGSAEVFLLSPKYWENDGAAMARYVQVNGGTDANVLFVNQSVFSFGNYMGKGISQTLKAECPGCSFSEIDTLPEEVGTKIPTAVISELQKNPSIDWVIFAYGAMDLGFPEALKAAGLEGQVNFISQSPSKNNFENLKSGSEVANLASNETFFVYYVLDSVARALNGEPVPDREDMQTGWFITGKDVTFDPATEYWEPVPNFAAQFEETWGVK